MNVWLLWRLYKWALETGSWLVIEHGSTNSIRVRRWPVNMFIRSRHYHLAVNTVYSILFIRCILSLSQAFLNNTELKIFGRHRESNPGPLVYRKKACERERMYLMSKRRLRKKLWNCIHCSYIVLLSLFRYLTAIPVQTSHSASRSVKGRSSRYVRMCVCVHWFNAGQKGRGWAPVIIIY